jgi:glycosyltransferase involved in cell wall biosynthesis
MKYGLSLVIACYNEEGHLEESFCKLKNKLKDLHIPYEIILVEDKSTDETRNVIEKIRKKNPSIRCIFHKKNVGRGGTVSDGIYKSKYEFVGFLDVDLEISEKYINRFVDELRSGHDVIIARRTYALNFESLHRVLLSKCYLYLERTILAVPFHDTEAGYKFFRTSKIIPILKRVKDKKWFWDTEIVVRSYLNNLKIKEVPVVFTRRKDKQSTVHLLRDSLYYFTKLLQFKKIMRISSFPVLSMIYHYRGSAQGVVYAILKSLVFPIKEMNSFIPKNGLIIDVGCAEGILTNFVSITNPKAKIIGIDMSPIKINKAKSLYTKKDNVIFISTDVFNYNFPKCNGVIASDFLHHLNTEEQNTLLETITKVLHKDGVLIIKEVDKNSGLRSVLSRFWDFVFYPHDVIYYRKKSDWVKKLKALGFFVFAKDTSFLSPFSTTLIVGTKK